MCPHAQLVLSGNVYHRKELSAGIGDVAIHPGSGRTPYIDAAIFDGGAWRALDLKGFGFGPGSRVFGQPDEVGDLMRQIERKIVRCKGASVHYDLPEGSKRRKYIYRGVPFSSFMQRNHWNFN